MISTERLADLFVEVADTLVADFDLVDFLVTLCEHANLVSSADAVGIVLTDHRGQLRFMASSNESGRDLELFQLQSEEGPCLDCVRTKEPVVNADLAQASNLWPQFAPLAIGAGFQSVHAFPMRLRDEVIGALNLFQLDAGELRRADVDAAQALADIATIAISSTGPCGRPR